ncbi:uncharacterized protein CBL_08333 [Carabus blaptoides fortunei]
MYSSTKKVMFVILCGIVINNVLSQLIGYTPDVDYPIYNEVPPGLSFTCNGLIPGYYSDPEARCQVWHWCANGKQYSFLCPNGTVFNQYARVCDWFFNVDCPSKRTGVLIAVRDTNMKRPPQLWLVTIGILCLSFIHSSISLRATSLIFSKTTTTTSTTEAPPASEEPVTPTSENSAEANNTVTKPPLTGIPQIDYIWDPNLPFELKNYNLSDYPFYDRVPDTQEIDFKCDGLHDGFYASVPHKCQVYHHCLFGTRYDFLCANFTAFDQKTFICHFASEVDCINSPKYWHRNDALYQAASTTTLSTTTAQVVVTPAPINRRPIAAVGGRRRRPLRRRRPQYEYYYDDEEYETDRDRDDYYDDPPPRAGNRRRNRPRPNRRPEYDEYDEYPDERFERRGSGRRDEDRERRPYDRRGGDSDTRYETRRLSEGAKNKDRRFDDDENDRRSTDRRPQDNKKPNDRRRPPTDDDDYDRRSYDRPRKPSRDRYDDDADVEPRRTSDRPRKSDGDDRRYRGGKDPKVADDDDTARRPYERPRKQDDDSRPRAKDTKVAYDDKEERRTYDRPRKPLDDDSNRRVRPKSGDRSRGVDEPKVKSSSASSVYDRPRASPVIRRPVPLAEREKFYKPTVTTKTAKDPLDEEEYYDEYEDEPKPVSKPTRKSSTESGERRGSFTRPRRPPTSSRRPVDDVDEEVQRPTLKRTQSRTQQERSRPEPTRVAAGSKKHRVVEDDYEDEYDEEDKPLSKEDSSKERERPGVKESRDTPVTKIESNTQESVARERDRGEQKKEPIVRIVKRPFLPSRGGSPYVARGLQPVGSKALDITPENNDKQISDESEQQFTEPESKISDTGPRTSDNPRENEPSSRPPFRSSPPYNPVEEDTEYEDEIKPITSRSRGEIRHKNTLPRTTQKPKALDNYRNPLDINENEYDVTLNDALNPTIPNLPVRNVPTGFSQGEPTYQRSRFVSLDTPALSPAGSDFVYQIKQPQDTQARYNPYVTVQQLNYRHPSSGSGQYYTTFPQ